ncbi:hypothetical protein EVAR_82419_1 [Eumeta japonica]|uniref:Uncharacterized protein n=1 Tax=Eumeta variegata TaxID=151549 RepID=A0A4C1YF58_EUMVA|nr:hypothetical protein EVAR_82419_1 [Eumeta japonica]
MDKLRKPANIIKQKWSESSTSLRSRHIVDLALSKSDQSLRSPVPANPFASDPRSFVGAAISVIFHIITTIQTPQNGRLLFVLAVYRHFEKPAPKIPMSMSTCENA